VISAVELDWACPRGEKPKSKTANRKTKWGKDFIINRDILY
jgi:hypothetical protein